MGLLMNRQGPRGNCGLWEGGTETEGQGRMRKGLGPPAYGGGERVRSHPKAPSRGRNTP